MKVLVVVMCLSVLVSATPDRGIPGGLYFISHAEAYPIALFAASKLTPPGFLLAIPVKMAQVISGTMYHLTIIVWRGFRVEVCHVKVLLYLNGVKHLNSASCWPIF